ncbi:hypothetical protein ACFQ48_13325 [Hymenobacter caeli]|uniref:Uncharacterized protein n=1 Tax=Hymenobacter caeli TaxID=2735894 RepID=A0ABX2FVE6_9BACT|nr:hypothetical protein [Hymenobacter caeli]NRT20402.1 hypothetical protein [Hymenobacter caeli]
MSRRAKWLPPWPVVPPRLWATAGVAGLAVLSLTFEHELWSNTLYAEAINWAVLLGALAAAGPQIALMLWRWPAAYVGPWWLGVLFVAGARALAVWLLVMEVLGCAGLAALMGVTW